MSDASPNEPTPPSEDPAVRGRRLFLQGIGKWSGAAIIAAVTGVWFGGAPEAGAWINRRGGGGWINRGGGGSWINRGGGWINRGGSWINGGGWINRAGGWINRRGGGGSWINRW